MLTPLDIKDNVTYIWKHHDLLSETFYYQNLLPDKTLVHIITYTKALKSKIYRSLIVMSESNSVVVEPLFLTKSPHNNHIYNKNDGFILNIEDLLSILEFLPKSKPKVKTRFSILK